MIHGQIAYTNLLNKEVTWLNSEKQTVKIMIFDQRGYPIKAVRLGHNEEVKIPSRGRIEIII